MAVTKIHPIKSTLNKALSYICNPDKTDEKILISSYGCSYETADLEFTFTLSQARQKGNNLAHHLIQSFAPGEVSYEEAHKIGQELADKVLGGKYEYVISTHIDKGHIHNHIIFCAVDFIDHYKYNSNKQSYYQIRNESDRLCREHGLSVVTPGQNKGKKYAEWDAERKGTSWKAKLKAVIDTTIPQAKDFEDFLRLMEAAGYEKWAKIHNLKQAAKTMNFLTEHDILQYEQLQSILNKVHGECEQTAASLKDVEKRLSDMALLMKNVSAYQQTKPVYEACQKARNKEKFRQEHESSLIIYEAAAKTLQAARNGDRLPNIKKLQSDYKQLMEQKDRLYEEYAKLKKKVKQYDTIKQNVDGILRQPKQAEREQKARE